MKMGVHGGGKIAGHSGTDFKHRQGFKSRRENLWYRQRIGKAIQINEEEISLQKSPIIKTSKRFQTHPLERLLKISLAFITVTLIITVIVFAQRYGKFFDPYYYSKEGQLPLMKEREDRMLTEHRDMFRSYLLSGKTYLNSGKLDEAQYYLVLALDLYPRDSEANLLMTKLLVKRCNDKNQNCNDAKNYLNSVYHLDDIDKFELEELEQIINTKRIQPTI